MYKSEITFKVKKKKKNTGSIEILGMGHYGQSWDGTKAIRSEAEQQTCNALIYLAVMKCNPVNDFSNRG